MKRLAVTKKAYTLCGGPFHGHTFWLVAGGDGNTLPIFVADGNWKGRYANGKWEPA